MNIANWLYEQGLLCSDDEALIIGTKVTANYKEFAQAAYLFSQRLKNDFGCQVGDRVIVFAKNKLEYLIALYGALWGGFVIAPTNYRLHPKEVEWVLEDTEAKVILTDDGLFPKN